MIWPWMKNSRMAQIKHHNNTGTANPISSFYVSHSFWFIFRWCSPAQMKSFFITDSLERSQTDQISFFFFFFFSYGQNCMNTSPHLSPSVRLSTRSTLACTSSPRRRPRRRRTPACSTLSSISFRTEPLNASSRGRCWNSSPTATWASTRGTHSWQENVNGSEANGGTFKSTATPRRDEGIKQRVYDAIWWTEQRPCLFLHPQGHQHNEGGPVQAATHQTRRHGHGWVPGAVSHTSFCLCFEL